MVQDDEVPVRLDDPRVVTLHQHDLILACSVSIRPLLLHLERRLHWGLENTQVLPRVVGRAWREDMRAVDHRHSESAVATRGICGPGRGRECRKDRTKVFGRVSKPEALLVDFKRGVVW